MTFGLSSVNGRSRVPAPAASTTPATLSAMQTRRWLDPSQPQTLQIAVFLLYAQAVVSLLFSPFLVLLLVAKLAGIPAGYGIANERKWAYGLGIIVAFSPFIVRIIYYGINRVLSTDLISLMFEVALVLLLLHPQSREYERIWFK
jgi:hypothetical protein